MSAATLEKVTAPSGATLEVGDFLYSSWGYDQTNVDFYKVVGFSPSGKSVKIQKWSKAVSDNGGPTAFASAAGAGGPATGGRGEDGCYDPSVEAPVLTKRLRVGGYCDFSVTLNSYASAYKWGGEQVYQTGYGWGH